MIGVPLFIAALTIWVWSYRRNCISHRVLVKKTKDEMVWKVIPDDVRKKEDIYVDKIVHAIAFFLIIGICVWIILG